MYIQKMTPGEKEQTCGDSICGYSVAYFMKMLEAFHGHLAPGLLIGGYMVDLARQNLQDCEFYDSICETSTCLPDAVQILTPCTYGNGWLKVINVGRFALALFNKYTGSGVRVNLDCVKLENYPEIKNWFFKLKRKDEQDKNALIGEIIRAERRILNVNQVVVAPSHIGKKKGRKSEICTECGESFPLIDNENVTGRCQACNGEPIYSNLHACVEIASIESGMRNIPS